MQKNDLIEDKQRVFSKYLAIAATVIYVLMFPFLLGISFTSLMVFDKPNLSTLFGLMIIFAFFCMPFSILPSIVFIWSNYSKRKYKKMYFYCCLPVLIFVLSMLLVMGLAEINDMFFPLISKGNIG
jgi:hypothetical protein